MRAPAIDDFQWSNDTRITNNNTGDLYPQLVIDRDSDNLVAWQRSGQQFIKWFNTTGGGQIPEMALVNGSIPVQHTGQPTRRMLVDSDYTIHFIWNQYGFYDSYYGRFESGDTSNSTPYAIRTIDATAHVPYIALAPLNKVLLGCEYGMYDDYTALARFTDGSLDMIRYNIAHESAGIVLGTDGNSTTHILTRNATANGGVFHTMFSYKGVLTEPTALDTPINASGVIAPMPAMAFGPDCSMHLLQASQVNGIKTLYYSKYDSLGRLIAGHIPITGTAADFGDIAVDRRGYVLIIWGDSKDGDLYYVWSAPGAENQTPTPVKLTSSDGRSTDPCIAFDKYGVPRVVWMDERDGNAEIYYKMAAVPALELSMTPEEMYKVMYAHPRESRNANFTIYNPGGMNETVTLELITDPHGREGWVAKLARQQVQLGPGEKRKFQVTVTGPTTGENNEYVDITIIGRPQNSTLRNSTLKFRTYLVVQPNFRLSIPDNVHSTAAGTPTVFKLLLYNNGDHTLDIDLRILSPPDWNATLNQTSVKNLTVRQTRDLLLTVTPPYSAMGNDKAIVAVEGRNATYNLAEKESVTVIVERQVSFDFSVNRTSAGVVPGATADYLLTCQLDGNDRGAVSFALETNRSYPEWNISFSTTSLSLRMGEPQMAVLSVTAPAKSSPGDNITLTVVCRSEDDTISASVQVSAIVGALHRLEVVVDQGPFSIFPGQETTALLWVCNTGNVPEEVFPGPAGTEEGWGMRFERLDGERLTPEAGLPIDRGGRLSLVCVVSAPPGALVGDVTVNGSLADSTGNIMPFQLPVHVELLYSVALEAPVPRLAGKAGASAVFGLAVLNLGNGPDDVTLSVHGLPAGWQSPLFGEPYAPAPVICELLARGSANRSLMVLIPVHTPLSSLFFEVHAGSSDGGWVSIGLVVDILKPDLTISSVAFSPGEVKLGNPHGVDVTVSNCGTAEAYWFELVYYQDKDFRFVKWLDPLPPGQCHTFSFEWLPSAGRHTLRWYVDPADQVTELNETNNIATSELYFLNEGPEKAKPIVMQAAIGLVVLGTVLCAASLYTLRRARRSSAGAGAQKYDPSPQRPRNRRHSTAFKR